LSRVRRRAVIEAVQTVNALTIQAMAARIPTPRGERRKTYATKNRQTSRANIFAFSYYRAMIPWAGHPEYKPDANRRPDDDLVELGAHFGRGSS